MKAHFASESPPCCTGVGTSEGGRFVGVKMPLTLAFNRVLGQKAVFRGPRARLLGSSVRTRRQSLLVAHRSCLGKFADQLLKSSLFLPLLVSVSRAFQVAEPESRSFVLSRSLAHALGRPESPVRVVVRGDEPRKILSFNRESKSATGLARTTAASFNQVHASPYRSAGRQGEPGPHVLRVKLWAPEVHLRLLSSSLTRAFPYAR